MDDRVGIPSHLEIREQAGAAHSRLFFCLCGDRDRRMISYRPPSRTMIKFTDQELGSATQSRSIQNPDRGPDSASRSRLDSASRIGIQNKIGVAVTVPIPITAEFSGRSRQPSISPDLDRDRDRGG